MSHADDAARPAPIDRRAFLHQLEQRGGAALCARGAAQAILPLLAAACAGARYAPSTLQGERLAVARADVGTNGALVEAPGSALPVFVRALDGGRFVALSTRCMHRGCQVEPAVDRLVCPCHGSEYALDGAVLKGPTEKPLARFHVTSSETHLFVHLDQPIAPEGPA